MHVRLRRPSPALVIALLALFVALGGPAQAKRLIGGKDIKRGAVRSKQIRNHGVALRDLTRGAVRSLQRTPDGSVGAAQLQPGAVTAGALAANTITGASITDGTITSAELADGAVTTAKIGTGQVRRSDISAGAVAQSEIATNAVSGDEVADGQLAAKDLGDFAATLTLAVPGVPVDECRSLSAAATATARDSTLLDDIVLVGQPQGWPPALTLSARPKDAATLDLTVCNVGNALVAPATRTFSYLAIQP
jgi:hypothetical protein